MRIEEYPPQEPLSPAGLAYHANLLARRPAEPGLDIAYGADPYQGLLLYPAAKPGGDILFFLHGGGWTSGYKEWMAFMAPGFTAAGVTFVSAGYRLAPAHVFPAGFDDCCAALAKAIAEASSRGGAVGRVFVGGHSAGGHYAALMAVRRDWQSARGLPRNVIRGCLPISGVYRFGEGSGLSAWPRFLGPADAPDAAARAAAASPVGQISSTPPPFLVAYGTKDFPHLIGQAEEMVSALRQAGGDVTDLPMEGRDHFSASYAGGETGGPWLPKALAWMATH
jgi:arylformamidase